MDGGAAAVHPTMKGKFVMSTMFEDREKTAERIFVQDRERAFKIAARRNRLLGLWAARHMGLLGDDATRYAMGLVDAEVTAPGDAALITRVCADLAARGMATSEAEVRRQLADFASTARREVHREAGISE